MVAARFTIPEAPTPQSTPTRQSAARTTLEFSGLLLVGLVLAWCGICLGFGLAAGRCAWTEAWRLFVQWMGG
jgi:hypothetical protein